MENKDVLRGEFIGKQIIIQNDLPPNINEEVSLEIKSYRKRLNLHPEGYSIAFSQYKNLQGKIIDETKNSFLIKTKNNMRKRILKQNLLFELKTQAGNIAIDGNSILMKPEDRIKKWK